MYYNYQGKNGNSSFQRIIYKIIDKIEKMRECRLFTNLERCVSDIFFVYYLLTYSFAVPFKIFENS